MDVEIRPFTADDRAAGFAMRVDAFSSAAAVPYPEDGEAYIPDDRRMAAFLGRRLVGQAGAWDFGQWYLGRRLPMAGVAGVIVEPELRGQGVASLLLRDLVQAVVQQGDLVSCLNASAPAVYRKLGWAMGGVLVKRTLPTAALADLPRPLDPPEVRPLSWPDDFAGVRALYDEQAAGSHGQLHRGETFHRRLLAPDEDYKQWVAERHGRVVGHVQLEKSAAPDPDDASVFNQAVTGFVADDRDTWLALWRLAGAQAPVCRTTHLVSSPHDPLLEELALNPQAARLETWMVRVLDVAGAVAGRGWPEEADITVPLRLHDAWLPRNDGSVVLRVSGGKGSLEPGGAGRVQMDIGAFSAMFSGHAQPATLRWQGRLEGAGASDLEALTVAFRSPQPFMTDHF